MVPKALSESPFQFMAIHEKQNLNLLNVQYCTVQPFAVMYHGNYDMLMHKQVPEYLQIYNF